MNCNTRTNSLCAMSTCCIESMGAYVDPLSAEGVIAAGDVCAGTAGCATGCQLAKIYFPNQEYRAGYTPENALQAGTMFPELVRCYK